MRETSIVLLGFIVGLAMGLFGHFFEPGRILYLAPGATEITCSGSTSNVLRGAITLPPVPPIDIADDFNQIMKGDKQ